MDNLILFGKRLMEVRKGKGLTQKELSAQLGISHNSLYSYEVGKVAPTVQFLYDLADIGVDVVFVLTGAPRGAPIQDEMARLMARLTQLSARERAAVTLLVGALLGAEPCHSEAETPDAR